MSIQNFPNKMDTAKFDLLYPANTFVAPPASRRRHTIWWFLLAPTFTFDRLLRWVELTEASAGHLPRAAWLHRAHTRG